MKPTSRIAVVRTLLAAVALLGATLMSSSRLTAAPPPLPAQVLGDEVIGVLWIDALAVDTAQLANAVKHTFGEHAGPVNDWLKRWQPHHAAFVRAGGTSMALIYVDPTSARGMANPVYLFSKSPRADAAALHGIINKVAGSTERGISHARIESIGDWIYAFDRRLAQPYLEKGKADRLATFRAALAPIAEQPAVIAFVPNKRFRILTRNAINLARHEYTAYKRMMSQLLECESLSIAVSLGSSPAVTAKLVMPTVEDANAIGELRDDLLKALSPFVKRSHMAGVPVPLIPNLFASHAVFAHAKLSQQGRMITTHLEGDTLKAVGTEIGGGVRKMLAEADVVLSINKMKVLIVALLSYAEDNGGRFPASLDVLAEANYVDGLNELLANPRTGKSPGYVYIRPRLTLDEMFRERLLSKTPVLLEGAAGRAERDGLVAYANGEVKRPEEK